MDLPKLLGVVTILGSVILLGVEEMKPDKSLQDKPCEAKIN